MLIILILLTSTPVFGDKTTCMSNIETQEGIHITCFCDIVKYVDTQIRDDPEADMFSLAEFAYNLSGAYFNKFLHITFQSCRHLALILDQAELTRIGSTFFRPDIRVKSIDAEQIYHLDLVAHKPPQNAEEYTLKTDALQSNLTIDLYAVALVKIDAGAKFQTLQVESDNGLPTSTVLYIDLNKGSPGDEERLNVNGFVTDKIYFITKRNQKIPLKKVYFFTISRWQCLLLNILRCGFVEM